MLKWLILVNDPMCDTVAHGPYDTKKAAQEDIVRWFDVAFDQCADEKRAECDLTSDHIEIEDTYGTIELTLIELTWF